MKNRVITVLAYFISLIYFTLCPLSLFIYLCNCQIIGKKRLVKERLYDYTSNSKQTKKKSENNMQGVQWKH